MVSSSGHGVTFINDRYPRATRGDGALQTAEDWQVHADARQEERLRRLRRDHPVRRDDRRERHGGRGERRDQGCGCRHGRGRQSGEGAPQNRRREEVMKVPLSGPEGAVRDHQGRDQRGDPAGARLLRVCRRAFCRVSSKRSGRATAESSTPSVSATGRTRSGSRLLALGIGRGDEVITVPVHLHCDRRGHQPHRGHAGLRGHRSEALHDARLSSSRRRSHRAPKR